MPEYEYRGRLRWAYLQLYADNPDFREALRALYAAHVEPFAAWVASYPELWRLEQLVWPELVCPDGSPLPPRSVWAREYMAALNALAARFRLDRLPDGAQTIHNWARLAAQAITDGRTFAPEWFGHGEGWGGGYPDIGEVVSRQESLGPQVDGVQWRIVDERRAPLVHIHVEDEWDPRREPMAAARKRVLAALTAQLDTELERIADDAVSREYVFHDTSPKLGQYLRWLFQHVALGKSYTAIARDELDDPTRFKTVEGRAREIARELGVSLSRRSKNPPV